MKISTKRIMIDKANAQMIAMISGASLIVVFSIVASRALISQSAYQSRVISQKEKALSQLKANEAATAALVASYNSFENKTKNVIGGDAKGSNDRDGDNAKIVLDALPSQYDFPALVTSLEKLLISPDYKIESITGTDDELNQSANTSSPNPQPVELPFSISVNGNFASLQKLVSTLDNSIRPFQFKTLELSGVDNNLKADITASTYYQPEKNLTIRTEIIK